MSGSVWGWPSTSATMLALKAIWSGVCLNRLLSTLRGVRVALALDDHAHAVAVGLVPEVGDALELAALDEVRDLLQQRRLVDLVGQLGGDDRRAALAGLLERALGACITTRPRPWAYMSRMASTCAPAGPVNGLRRSS